MFYLKYSDNNGHYPMQCNAAVDVDVDVDVVDVDVVNVDVVDVDAVIVLARARLCKQTENLFLKKDTGGGFLSSWRQLDWGNFFPKKLNKCLERFFLRSKGSIFSETWDLPGTTFWGTTIFLQFIYSNGLDKYCETFYSWLVATSY